MQCEIVAVGTELLLGANLDTNSAWISDQLAQAGIDCRLHTSVGDNLQRIVDVLRGALERSDAVIVTGGLGPTQDDITRDAIAVVMGVSLERVSEQEDVIREIFRKRNREMSVNNLRQADRPIGAQFIPAKGTAPGLICPVDSGVIYAVPGVPWEMQPMVTEVIIPDLRRRMGEPAVIRTRTLRCWGTSESAIAESLNDKHEQYERDGVATLAFLAKGIEGIHVRVSVKAVSVEAADALLDAEMREIAVLLSDVAFGYDDATMEAVVGEQLVATNQTLSVAESLTGGLVAKRCTDTPGASRWFRGGVVSYASDVKFDVLHVAPGPVVAESAAREMALGVKQLLGSDVAVSLTGVAGPDEQDGQPVGTVFVGFAFADGTTDVERFSLFGDRQRIREFACISALNALRVRLGAQ